MVVTVTRYLTEKHTQYKRKGLIKKEKRSAVSILNLEPKIRLEMRLYYRKTNQKAKCTPHCQRQRNKKNFKF